MNKNKLSLLKWFPISILFIFIIAIAGCGGGSDDEATPDNATPPEDSIKIPVNFNAASNVGSLHMELVYDPSILKAINVKASSLVNNGVVKANIDTPGRAVIGIIDATGINGDGPAVEVSFDVIGSGLTYLNLENVEAADSDTLRDIITQVRKGEYNTSDDSSSPPGLSFSE